MSFYYFTPGPSQIEPNLEIYIAQALQSGILSTYHRSAAFHTLYAETLQLCQEKLDLPKDYTLYFFSSATECWSVLSESIVKKRSVHICNGAFADKWKQYAAAIKPAQAVQLRELEEQDFRLPCSDLFCITLNETSNGSFFPFSYLEKLKANHPEQLIALDVTSCLGGIELPWDSGDFWFGSVQKCLGLPPGLALLFVSPRGVEKIQAAGETGKYNSLYNVHKNYQHFETTHTPNILNIYLLKQILSSRAVIATISKQTYAWANRFYEMLAQNDTIHLLEKNALLQSPTLIACQIDSAPKEKLTSLLLAHNIIIGNGYGQLQSSTFRIANFPQMPPEAKNILLQLLYNFYI
jgi:phosphoserine aminotransferase